ncbi:MAG: thiamine diphosphokinase [Elusimicrobia bacterium]|nr:thiamine diphosphokinase [Elusimicrobiota bacterium]
MPPKFTQPALILADGDLPEKKLVHVLSKRAPLTVCTDGAYRKALRLGLKPGWIVGDMDSLPSQVKISASTRVVYDPDPNCSDLEKALKFLIKFGCGQATLVGTMGDRMDHSFAAFTLMEKYADRIKLRLVHRGWSTQMLSQSATLRLPRGTPLALFAHPKARVSTSGLEYPLKKEWLTAGSRGISNRTTATTVKITLHQGRILLMWGRVI